MGTCVISRTAEELKRKGGFGVYYHASYLGAPFSYIWLDSTPPALIWEEMSKAYDRGVRQVLDAECRRFETGRNQHRSFSCRWVGISLAGGVIT